jgi:acetyl esterase/lipase
MRFFWPLLRLLCAAAFFSAALLAVVQAPNMPLFRVAVLVTEFGHWLFILPLFLAFLPAARTPINCFATALALLASMLFLSSAIQANVFARHLPAELAHAFPAPSSGTENEQSASATPFSWKRLWSPPPVPAVPVEQCIYARHDDQTLKLLFYHQANSSPTPCVIAVHGSRWINGSAEDYAIFNHYLAGRGYAVAAIEYRPAPRWTWPAQRDDVLDAIDYVQEHATELGIDPRRIVLLGRSTGGQIVEAVAYGAHIAGLRGCIAFYAPSDMHYAYERARKGDVLNAPQLVGQYLGGAPTEARANYDSASSILLAQRESPPTLLIHGRRDELVRCQQSARLCARLKSVGAPHYFVCLPWATHTFDLNFNGPGGQISTYAVEAFLRSVTR